MLEKYNPNEEYFYYKECKCGGFSYLQYLIVHYHKIDNCLQLIKEDIKNNDINYINHKNELEWTALALACYNPNSSSEIVKLLIQNGADINIKNNLGWTPLLIACCNPNSSSDIVKLLIQNGDDVNLLGKYGNNALMIACKYIKNISILDILKILIDNGSDINIKDFMGWTALMVACANLNKETYLFDVLKLLIENKAKINYKFISKHIFDENIIQLFIDRINFDDIKEVKIIYSQIYIKNKNFINFLLLNILKQNYIDLDKIYITNKDINKEDYNKIIELNNKSMIKRV